MPEDKHITESKEWSLKDILSETPKDTEQHESTKIKGKRQETTVWKFRDTREARLSIYKGDKKLEQALTDLVIKTNGAIYNKKIPGKILEVGDIIQACVDRYFLNNQLYEPETKGKSPAYATLPYEIIEAEEKYLTTKLAIPEEMAMHFNIPKKVGDLIPILTPEQKQIVLVTLQLKEAHKHTKEEIEEIIQGKTSKAEYKISQVTNGEAAEFGKYLKDQKPDTAEWQDFKKGLPLDEETLVIPREDDEKTKELKEKLRIATIARMKDDCRFGEPKKQKMKKTNLD